MLSKHTLVPICLFFISGTISTFAYKLQSSVTVSEGPYQKNFFHPYMQCFTMFIGQAICIIFYLSRSSQQISETQQGKIPHRPWVFIITAFADSCSSTLSYIALCFIPTSTWLMFGGMRIVWTALFAKILLKVTLQKRHFVGCGLAIIGVTIVGSSVFILNDSEENTSQNQQFLGYAMMLISLVFGGFYLAYEQYLLTKHTIDPLQMVGYEGIFGMIITLVLSFILSFIPCPFGQDNCVYNSKGDAYFQLPFSFFKEVFTNLELAMLVLFGLLTLGVFNLNGVKITKLFDALTRSLLGITKTSIVWIIGVIITAIDKNNKALHIESLSVGVNLVKGLGFLFTIVGTLIYNKLIFQKYFDQDKNNQGVQFKAMNEETTNQQYKNSI